MEWFYSNDGADQKGPVTREELVTLAIDGHVTGRTLIWNDSMKDWLPLSSSPLVESGELGVCVHSGKVMDRDQMTPYGDHLVDPACKDEFVQTLMEQGDETIPLDGVSQKPLAVISNISKGFATVNGNLWPIIGISLLNTLIQSIVSQLSPLNVFAQLHLMGGLNYYLLKNCRRQPNSIEDSFTGFSKAYATILLIMLIMFGIILVLMVLLVIPFVIFGGLLDSGSFDSEAVALGVMIPVIVLLFAAMMYVNMVFFWAPVLAIDRGLPLGAALSFSRKATHAHFFPLLGLFLLVGLINIAGVLCLIVGVFYTMPASYAAMMHAYDHMFSSKVEAPQQALPTHATAAS